MTHSRFALGFTRNRKVFGLSDAAFRLYVSAIDWSREQRTDGVLTEKDMPAIPRLPRSWRASAVELVGAGLWEAIEGGWSIVDWCEPEETELSAKRAEAGRKGGLAKASKQRLANVATDVATGLAKPTLPGGNATDPSSPLELPSPDSLSFPSDSGLLAASSLIPDPEPAESFSHVGAAKPKRRWRKVPTEWQPTEEHRALARERGVDFELELSRFRDHEFASPKSDANATFRNWLRNARPTRAPVTQLTPRGGGQNFARLTARIARLELEEAEREAH